MTGPQQALGRIKVSEGLTHLTPQSTLGHLLQGRW